MQEDVRHDHMMAKYMCIEPMQYYCNIALQHACLLNTRTTFRTMNIQWKDGPIPPRYRGLLNTSPEYKLNSNNMIFASPA